MAAAILGTVAASTGILSFTRSSGEEAYAALECFTNAPASIEETRRVVVATNTMLEKFQDILETAPRGDVYPAFEQCLLLATPVLQGCQISCGNLTTMLNKTLSTSTSSGPSVLDMAKYTLHKSAIEKLKDEIHSHQIMLSAFLSIAIIHCNLGHAANLNDIKQKISLLMTEMVTCLQRLRKEEEKTHQEQQQNQKQILRDIETLREQLNTCIQFSQTAITAPLLPSGISVNRVTNLKDAQSWIGYIGKVDTAEARHIAPIKIKTVVNNGKAQSMIGHIDEGQLVLDFFKNGRGQV